NGDNLPAALNIWGTRKTLYGLLGVISSNFTATPLSAHTCLIESRLRAAGPRMAQADAILAEEVVVSGDANTDQSSCENSQSFLPNSVGCHALSAIDSFKDQAEQQVRKLRDHGPVSSSSPSHPSEDFFDRIKGIPTYLVFRNEIFATDICMLDVIGLVYRLQPESTF